jgi:proton-translocating NADH-quinone oxidoreductase chain L
MSDIYAYLWLVPVLPLLAAWLIAKAGSYVLRQHSHWPCIVAGAGSCVLSVGAFWQSVGQEYHHSHLYFTLFQAGKVHVDLALRGDSLTLIMLMMVTFISTLIAIFAVGYMHGDPGYPRFFAEVSLFIAAMTLLVLGDNLVLLYAGWEGVGLCSYLLIGFWFTKPSAADAARKAFLVTRIGDAGFMLGILLVWSNFGYHLDYDSIFQEVQRQYASGQLDPNVIFWVCFLLFCGAAGKSAQFPLHVWLPDAMEGPTPVSALIHAATMVTAGVYLVARCTPLFALSPGAQVMVASVGGFTAIFAALIALTQNDLKRVLAYSTLSQLGYMFLALGSAIVPDEGGRASRSTTFAVAAAMFHLFTHAFFKALLFLSAGSVMHAMGNVIDMRRFSGLRKVLPQTHWTFLCGALALAGFPLLSGFWSKDEILDAVLHASEGHTAYAGIYLILLVVGLVTAALTAFYTFRAYFMTFWGELRVPPEAGQHGHGDYDAHGDAGAAHHPTGEGQVHESPYVMTVPLMILAVFAVVIGGVLGPLGGNLFADYLSETLTIDPYGFNPIPHEMNWLMMGASSVIALGGIALAYYFYVAQPALPRRVATSMQSLYQLSLNKFYIDEIYEWMIVQPLNVLTRFAKSLDQYGIDSVVDLIGQLPRLLGSVFQPVQNGLVQYYALTMMVGLVVFLIALIRNL